MQRQQFTFYRSFWDALQALPKKEQLSFVRALCAYALDGEDPVLSGPAASSFCLAKPVLDTARRRAESGRAGGSKPKSKRKQTESNPEATGNQTEREKENEKEKEREKEGENECYSPSPSDDGDSPPPAEDESQAVVAVVVRAVGKLSAKSQAELSGFVRDMGRDCVLRALEAAQDAGKPAWSYVRGVLRHKRDQGVRSIQDWDRVEARFQGAKNAAKPTIAGTPRCVQPDPERAEKNSQWLEDFLKEQGGS